MLPEFEEDSKPETASLDDFITRHQGQQSVDIKRAKYLSNVADIVQVEGWRQHRYVRCPDVAWALHTHTGFEQLPALADFGVQQCLTALAENSSPILKLPNHINAFDLARALRHVNVERRESISVRRPPMISWAFIRAIEEEQDERFWFTLLKLIGAPLEDLEALLRSTSSKHASAHLEKALNYVSPNENELGHRAPDVLVIMGTKRFTENLQKTTNPERRLLAFDRVLKQLRTQQLLPPSYYYAGMEAFLGQTRIILLYEDSELMPRKSAVNPLTQSTQNVLNRLSVFRFGFTQQMASVLLNQYGYKGPAVRHILDYLLEQNFICYGLGEYHIPGQIGSSAGCSNDPSEEAERHYLAAIAQAPYLSTSNRMPGLAYDCAFLPEHVHEAEYHLTKAYSLATNTKDRLLSGSIQKAFRHVQLFSDVQGWHTVVRLLRSRSGVEYCYKLATHLVNICEQTGYSPHPGCLVDGARSAIAWWKSLPDQSPDKDVVRQKINELFDKADQACDKFEDEKDYNRLMVISYRASFLMENGGTEEEKDLADKLNKQCWDLLSVHVDGKAANGQWYELNGDQEEQHSRAVEIYRLGTQWSPDWKQNWVKYCGAYELANVSTVELQSNHGLSRERASDLYCWAQRKNYRSNKQHVMDRWRAGIDSVEKLPQSAQSTLA